MKKRILKLYENDVIRYIFWGGCTTLVNLVSFYIMRELGIILMAANVVSIILAILFAYVVNSRFVFHDQCATLADHIRPFLNFVITDMKGYFEETLRRSLQDIDLSMLTTYLTLDAGITEGKNEVQFLFVYDKESDQLVHCHPAMVKALD